MTGDVQPQDEDNGLVKRSRIRRSKLGGTLTVPDEATQREVMEIWHQVDRLARHADIPTIRAGAVQPQDKNSGLVKHEWVRRVRPDGKRLRRPVGDLRESTLEGEQVTATFLDPHGGSHRVAGKVIRNASGELVVESVADGLRHDANVDVLSGKPSRSAAKRSR